MRYTTTQLIELSQQGFRQKELLFYLQETIAHGIYTIEAVCPLNIKARGKFVKVIFKTNPILSSIDYTHRESAEILDSLNQEAKDIINFFLSTTNNGGF